MRLLDTHQHLIYRGQFGYSWTAGIPPLAQGDFALEDYQTLVAGKDVKETIFMETGVDDADYQAEARFIAKLVGKAGLNSQIASCRPEADDGFDAWLEECGTLQVCGFRRILHVMPDELSRSEVFRRNLRKIGRKGLAFDLCFLAKQLPIAIELVRACPDQTLVLDHCGVPDIAGGAFEDWAGHITALADFPNVHCKLSGISAYCVPNTCSAATLKPWVDHVLASFSPARTVWGGDWPVVNLGIGLPAWIDMSRELLSGLSSGEQAAVGWQNAQLIYA